MRTLSSCLFLRASLAVAFSLAIFSAGVRSRAYSRFPSALTSLAKKLRKTTGDLDIFAANLDVVPHFAHVNAKHDFEEYSNSQPLLHEIPSIVNGLSSFFGSRLLFYVRLSDSLGERVPVRFLVD